MPPQVWQYAKDKGFLGMIIPKEYGGLGFTVSEYVTVMQMVGSLDGNIGALLSAHQSIGVPQPLKLFGTPEQKKKYLPRCAAGAISAFALTEPHVGSDPASLSTTAELKGDTYVINGEKLALKEVGNKVGKYKIDYVSLDDSTAQNPGTADEGQTAQNARKAVQDESTIFYLGEFNSGGTKVSLPILNKANIPQISPSNTYRGRHGARRCRRTR